MKIASMKLQIAVLAPIPSASDSAAVAVNSGLAAIVRKAWRMSGAICSRKANVNIDRLASLSDVPAT